MTISGFVPVVVGEDKADCTVCVGASAYSRLGQSDLCCFGLVWHKTKELRILKTLLFCLPPDSVSDAAQIQLPMRQ